MRRMGVVVLGTGGVCALLAFLVLGLAVLPASAGLRRWLPGPGQRGQGGVPRGAEDARVEQLFAPPSPAEVAKAWEAFPKHFEARDFRVLKTSEGSAGIITEQISYRSQGLRIYGLLMRPRGAGPYPLVLYNHGGLDGLQPSPVMRRLVSRGYVVLASAYRGENSPAGMSEGSVEAGLGEVTDVLNLLECGKTLPYADARRIGMIGGSHGGWVTAQAIERSKDIRAAVDLYGMTDLLQSSEVKRLVYRFLQRPNADLSASRNLAARLLRALGVPEWAAGRKTDEEMRQALLQRSPVHFADRIQCPLLILHGGQDRAVQVAESEKLAEALRKTGKVFDLKVYPGAGHNFITQGSPDDMEDAWARVEAWFDKYLGPTTGGPQARMPEPAGEPSLAGTGSSRADPGEETLSPRAARSPSGTGIYALIPANQMPQQATLRSPCIVGVSVRTSWADVEPADGGYRWDYLDQCLTQAKEAGLLVMIRVIPDSRTPQWVYEAGAQRFEFTDTREFHKTFGQRLAIPVPWDAVFLDKWTRFVSALGERYTNDPNVSIIQCIGPTWHGGEMHLPKTADDAQRWKAIGYTPSRLLEAWQQVIDAYARSFPGHPFAINVARPIDDDEVVREIVNYGIAKYAPRFCVQGNWLSARTKEDWFYYRLVREAAERTMVGFQMTAAASHAKSSEWGKLQGDLRTSLDKGIRAGASYFEIYQPDVVNPDFTGDLQYAAEKVRQSM